MRASMSGRVSISYVWIGVRLWLVRSSVRPCVRSSGLIICLVLCCVANVSVCLYKCFLYGCQYVYHTFGSVRRCVSTSVFL